MIDIAQALLRKVKAAGVAIDNVEIGNPNDKATWKVWPPSQQAAAQPTITAFNPSDAATLAEDRNAQFTATSRQKDVLATCAEIVRARGITAWSNMTLQQKKDATLAEADVWVQIRSFIEDNL